MLEHEIKEAGIPEWKKMLKKNKKFDAENRTISGWLCYSRYRIYGESKRIYSIRRDKVRSFGFNI